LNAASRRILKALFFFLIFCRSSAAFALSNLRAALAKRAAAASRSAFLPLGTYF